MKVICLLFLLLSSAWGQEWSSIAQHNPPGLTPPELVYRGMGIKQYPVADFLSSYFQKKNVPLMSRSLYALKLSLEGEEYSTWYDLKNGPYGYNNKTVADLTKSAKKRKLKLNSADLAIFELSHYIDHLFNRSWKKIRELNLKSYAYEYEFGNGFLYFTRHQEIARLYGANIAVVKEKNMRGIDLNAFHFYQHQTEPWQTGDVGEYIVPVGVPFEEMIGLHFDNGYFALYKKTYKGIDYLLYFDLINVPTQCLTLVKDEYFYCIVDRKKPGPPKLTEKASVQAIIRVCNVGDSCDVPTELAEQVQYKPATNLSTAFREAVSTIPTLKILNN